MTSFVILTWYNPKNLFIILNRPPERVQQCLRINRRGDYPGAKLRFFTFMVELAKVDHKLECVMPHLEVIGVCVPSSFPASWFTFMVHSDLDVSWIALAHHRHKDFYFYLWSFSKMSASSYLSWGFMRKCRQDKGFGGMRSFGHEVVMREV